MTTGIYDQETRRTISKRAVILIGYVPVCKLTCFSKQRRHVEGCRLYRGGRIPVIGQYERFPVFRAFSVYIPHFAQVAGLETKDTTRAGRAEPRKGAIRATKEQFNTVLARQVEIKPVSDHPLDCKQTTD
jgi:hypothetical protein